MEQQVSWKFLEDERKRLSNKGYIEVRPPESFEFAMLKQTFGGTLPKVIAVIDATYEADSPITIFNRHQNWFKQLLKNSGAGAMIFVYDQPTATLVEEILQLGKGVLGYGQVVAGVYDVSSNKYWMSDHMGWPSEIFS